jgi:hypothetical protein
MTNICQRNFQMMIFFRAGGARTEKKTAFEQFKFKQCQLFFYVLFLPNNATTDSNTA